VKRIFGLSCFLTWFLLAFLGISLAKSPQTHQEFIFNQRYDTPSGVVRVWVYEGWQPGKSSLVRWLNGCAALYERQNDGLYLYITPVEESVMLSIGNGEFTPPDLVFFPPGLYETDPNFISIRNVTNSSNLRREFSSLPDCVLPVAMGGYCWAYSGEEEFPADLSQLRAAAYPDSRYHTWSAAAILSATYTYAQDSSIEESMPGLDLGLAESPENAPTPVPTSDPQNGQKTFPGADFRFSSEILREFCDGLPAILISQRELYRLNELADAPDFRILRTGESMLADQLFLAAVPEGPRSDAAADFVSYLLSEECQARLSEIGCFSVTGLTGLYPPGSQMGVLEQSVAEAHLAVPPAFSGYWRETAPALFEKCRAGELDAFSAARLLLG